MGFGPEDRVLILHIDDMGFSTLPMLQPMSA